MENIGTRIKEILDFKGLSVMAFEREIGAGNNTIGTSIKRNSNFSSSILSKILNCYPEINSEWLLTGKGKMIKETELEQVLLESQVPPNKTNIDLAYTLEVQKKYIKMLEDQLANTKRTDSILYKPPKHKLASE